MMRSLLGPLVPTILRHLEAYAELAGEDAREAATLLARKLAVILVAAACGFVAILILCAWILILAREGPWLSWVAAGLALVFAAAAVGLAMPVLRPRAGPPKFFARTRTEIGRDRELLERAFEERRAERRGNGGEREHMEAERERAAH
jgi:uncharacterized membrane protein YqjE